MVAERVNGQLAEGQEELETLEAHTGRTKKWGPLVRNDGWLDGAVKFKTQWDERRKGQFKNKYKNIHHA